MSTGTNTVDNYTNETRFALMEQSIQHMTQTLQRFEGRFDKIDQQFEKVDREIKEVQKELKGEIRSNFFWTLGALAAILGLVAHALKWI